MSKTHRLSRVNRFKTTTGALSGYVWVYRMFPAKPSRIDDVQKLQIFYHPGDGKRTSSHCESPQQKLTKEDYQYRVKRVWTVMSIYAVSRREG